MSVFHKIKAQLYDNALTENPNDLIARVVSEKSLGIGDIVRSALSNRRFARDGATVSAEDMEHAVNLFFKEMAYLLCDGFSINTGYFTAQPNIKGVFHSTNEKFNPKKHSVLFNFQQGSILRRELANVEVDILGVADSSLFITQVFDVKTESVNHLLTPNSSLKISGSNLKIAGGNVEPQTANREPRFDGSTVRTNGVYFVNQETNKRVKVDVSDMVTNNPSELIVVTPKLNPGTYKVEVTTQYGDGNLLKEAKTTVFERVLTVQ